VTSQQTHLVQVEVGSINADSSSHFQGQGSNVPVVLVPAARSCCSCYYTIPSGPHCIKTSWGKDVDQTQLAASGLQCELFWNQVSYCVVRGACTYQAPVKSCPTADNVMVDCDLVLIFEIGPDPVDIRKFCYKLGAARFDDFLHAAVEEATRQLIRTCAHTDVYELKGGADKRVQDTMKELNKKFTTFGVKFSRLAVTDVKFAPSLQALLQSVTQFESLNKEEIKKQKHSMDEIENTRNRTITELEQRHRRLIQDAKATRTRVEINRSELEVQFSKEMAVQITHEKQKASVRKTEADSMLATSESTGSRNKEESLAVTKAKESQTKITVAQECESSIFAAKARLAAAEAQRDALIIDAHAEAKASSSLRVMREHELRMAKMEVLQSMAANNKIVISGEQGDRLINELMDSSILGTMTLAE
jgi:hypothetical protein